MKQITRKQFIEAANKVLSRNGTNPFMFSQVADELGLEEPKPEVVELSLDFTITIKQCSLPSVLQGKKWKVRFEENL